MARQVLPIVGAVVGAFFGSPQIGYAIGAVVGNLVDPVINQGPKIGETGAQTSQEGAPRAIIYGTASCTGNIIAAGPIIKSTEVEEAGGGKGSEKSENEHAYRNYAIRICEGPIGGILRIWEDDKLVYDVRPGTLMLAESEKWIANKNVFLGDEEQLPSVFLNLNVPPLGEHPAHRGTAYIVFGLEDLTDRRGSIPQYRFEVAGTTESEVVLEPLMIAPWGGARPVHSVGETVYRVGVNDYYDFEVATDQAADEASGGDPLTAASFSKNFVAFSTSTENKPSVFDGGATIDDDPEYVTYRMAAELPDFWDSTYIENPFVCGALFTNSATPDDEKLYGFYRPDLDAGLVLSKFYSHDTAPTTGPFSNAWNNCTNYPSSGGYFPIASGTPTLLIRASRVASPPEDFVRVDGTAKQLAGITYRDGVLYQNALGPVLLPDDPNYNDDEFWDQAREDAILAGTLQEDITTPTVVGSYALGGQTVAGKPIELGLIVADIHKRCNVPDDRYEVSELTDLVGGLVLAGDYMGADAINTLRGPYFFDKAEYSKQLHYPKRGAAVVDTITIDDLVEEPDLSKREQALEFAKKMHLFYQHAGSGYAAVKATSLRSSPDARVVGETSLQVPVVLNEDQAAQIVSKLHKVSWAEAEGEITLSVPQSFIRFVPSNNVGLALRGQAKRLRLEKKEFADGVIKLTFRHDRQSAYTSNLTGVPIPPPTLPPSTLVGETTLAIMDISSRVDTEDDLHYLAAGVGALPAWYGYALQRSFDGGANYTTVGQFGPAVIGTLVEAIPTASEFYTDTTNVVRVQLIRDGQNLLDLSETQFLSEQGAFALEKNDGSWEIMQYRDAVQESSGIFSLSTLHRGLLNSAPSLHAVDSKFVLLNRVEHIPAQSAWIGQEMTHRAPSLGESPELAEPQTITYLGRSQIEWPVAYLQLSRDGSNNITASWTPRHRFGTEDAPVASINFQGYRVTLSDEDSKATFDTTAPGFVYDASLFSEPVTVTVSALNRITGAGPATAGII